MEIAGEAKYVDSRGKTHSIAGVGSLPDDINLQSLKVSGNIEFDEISCGKIQIEGSGEGKSLTAKSLTVNGSIEVDALKIEDSLEIRGSIEADGVEAGEIEIESRAGKIGSVKCGRIKIFSNDEHDVSIQIFKNLLDGEIKSFRHKRSSRFRIKTVVADKVDIENCEVDEITCTDADIGANCTIGKLIVSGECKVDDDSKVGEIIKEDAK